MRALSYCSLPIEIGIQRVQGSLQSVADQYTTVKNCKVWHITASEADYIVSLEGNKFLALLYARRLYTGKLVPKPVL